MRLAFVGLLVAWHAAAVPRAQTYRKWPLGGSKPPPLGLLRRCAGLLRRGGASEPAHVTALPRRGGAGTMDRVGEELADEDACRRFLAGPGVRAVVFAHALHAQYAKTAREAGAIVALVDAGEDEGEDAAIALGAPHLPWIVFGAAGAPKGGAAPGDVAAAIAKLGGVAAPPPDVRASVRDAYAATARGGPAVLPGDVGSIAKRSAKLGYGAAELEDGADLGLGCGNPLLAARLRAGEVVLDLGSGAGVDCFAASKMVGPTGRVIGVDMTPEMLERARGAAKAKPQYAGVSFRLGEIEHLPVGDGAVDCVISNCVINLSPDKPAVYREMNRVLRPGGRVSISDVLRTAPIPDALKTVEAYACWVSGASAEDEIRDMLRAAGFVDVRVDVKENGRDIVKDWIPGSGAEKYVTSAYVTATKPRSAHGMRDAIFFDSPGAAMPACPPDVDCPPGAPCCPPSDKFSEGGCCELPEDGGCCPTATGAAAPAARSPPRSPPPATIEEEEGCCAPVNGVKPAA